jgi:hypothetical protein
MELINATRMVAGYTVGIEPDGRELLIVVIKGTFRLPQAGEDLRLHEEQLALVMADTFTGEPGRSAPIYEADFAPRKLRCDILLLGSAYAPHGRPAARAVVGLQVGSVAKTVAVVGDRHWETGLGSIRASPAQPFLVKPISYDVAFGGCDLNHEDPSKHAAFMRNPVGRGFHRHLNSEWVDGTPLPNTEEMNRAVSRPDGAYAPMALGPIGRSWEPRYHYAGTYDQNWVDDQFPFLPLDFDDQYYQAAPVDQQLPVPTGPIGVGLSGLTPDGVRRFVLPHFDAPVRIFSREGGHEDHAATLDTIVFEPDDERFTMTWRVTRPLRRDIFDIAQAVVGHHRPRIQGEFVKEAEAAGLLTRSAPDASLDK